MTRHSQARPLGLSLALVLALSVAIASASVLFTYNKPSLFSNRFGVTSRVSRSLSATTTTTSTNNNNIVSHQVSPAPRSEPLSLGRLDSTPKEASSKPIVFEVRQLVAGNKLCSQHANQTNGDNNNNSSSTTIEFGECQEAGTTTMTDKDANNTIERNQANELINEEKENGHHGNNHEGGNNDNQFARFTALSSPPSSPPSSSLSLSTPGAFKQKSPMFGQREFLLAANAFTTDMTNKIVSNGLVKTSPNGQITVINGPAVTPVLYHQAKVPALPTFERLTATTMVNAVKAAMASPMTATAAPANAKDNDDGDHDNDEGDGGEEDEDDDDDGDDSADNDIDKTKKSNANKSLGNKEKDEKPENVKNSAAAADATKKKSAHQQAKDNLASREFEQKQKQHHQQQHQPQSLSKSTPNKSNLIDGTAGVGGGGKINLAGNVKSTLTNEVRRNNSLGAIFRSTTPTTTTTTPTQAAGTITTTVATKVSSEKSDDDDDDDDGHDGSKSHITSTVPSLFSNKPRKDPMSWRTRNNNRHSLSTTTTTAATTTNTKTGSSGGGSNKFKFGDKKLAANNEKESSHSEDNADNGTTNKKAAAENNATNQSKVSNGANKDDRRKTTVPTATANPIGSTSTTLSVFRTSNQERIEKLKAKYNKRPGGGANPVLIKPTLTRPPAPTTAEPADKNDHKPTAAVVVATDSPKGTSANPTRFTSKDVRRPSVMINKWRASQQAGRPKESAQPAVVVVHKHDHKTLVEEGKKSANDIPVGDEKKKLNVHQPEIIKATTTTTTSAPSKLLEAAKNHKEHDLKPPTLIPPVSNKYFHKDMNAAMQRYNDNPLRKPLPPPSRPQYKLVAPGGEPPGYHRPQPSTTPQGWNKFNQFVPAVVSPPAEQHLPPALPPSAPPAAKHVSYFNIHQDINKLPPSSVFSYPSSTPMPEVVVTVENKYIYFRNKTTMVEPPIQMTAPPLGKVKILSPPEHYLEPPPPPKAKFQQHYGNNFGNNNYHKIEPLPPSVAPKATMPVPTSNYFYYPEEEEEQIKSKPNYNTNVMLKRPMYQPESSTQMTQSVKHYPSIVVPSKTYSYVTKETPEYHQWKALPKIEQSRYPDFLRIPKANDVAVDKVVEHKAPPVFYPKNHAKEPLRVNKYEYYDNMPPQTNHFTPASKIKATLPAINNEISLKMLPEKGKAITHVRHYPSPHKEVNKWNENDHTPLTVPLLTDLRPKVYSHHHHHHRQLSGSRIFDRYGPQLLQAGPELTEDKLLYTETLEALPAPPTMHKPMFAPMPPPPPPPATTLYHPLASSSSNFHQRLVHANFKPPRVVYSRFPAPHIPVPVDGSAFAPMIPLRSIPYHHHHHHQQDVRKVFPRQVVNDNLSHDEQLFDSGKGVNTYRVEKMLNASVSGVDPFEEYYSDQILPVDSMIDFSLVWPHANRTMSAPMLTASSSEHNVTHHVDPNKESSPSPPRPYLRLLPPPFNTKKLYNLLSNGALFQNGKPTKHVSSVEGQHEIANLPQQSSFISEGDDQSKIFSLDAADDYRNYDDATAENQETTTVSTLIDVDGPKNATDVHN